MKQLENDKLCYYCLGCNAQELENFKPVMRCKNFMASEENWQEKMIKKLKGVSKNEL